MRCYGIRALPVPYPCLRDFRARMAITPRYVQNCLVDPTRIQRLFPIAEPGRTGAGNGG